jgi:hypothetical protein
MRIAIGTIQEHGVVEQTAVNTDMCSVMCTLDKAAG